jgi:lysophospholipase L1-like esterase
MRRLIALLIALVPTAAYADDAARPDCSAPIELTRLGEPLFRVAYRLSRNEALTILAFGSSSTAGFGASADDKTYPARLEAELRRLMPGVPIRVINRGIGGEAVGEMLARLQQDVIAERPDLVLWQVGTNALMRHQGVAEDAPLIREGMRRLRLAGADALLIDPQYAPKVLRDPDAQPMVELLTSIANEIGAPVFRRFALMQHWREARNIPFETFLSPDQLHMNDWSYGCLAQHLAGAIVDMMRRPQLVAIEPPPRVIGAVARSTVGAGR